MTLALILAGLTVASLAYRHTRPLTLLLDTGQFLRVARKIRRERRFPGVLEYNLMDRLERAEWDYPPLYILILALLPTSFLEKRMRVVTVAGDLVALAALTAAAWLLTHELLAVLVAVALYSFTPRVLQESGMLTARFFSIGLFSISMGLGLAYVQAASPWLLVGGALGGGLLLLSNALAIQAWALTTGALVLVSPDRLDWAVYGVLSIVTCYAMAGRVAWRVHRGLVRKLRVLRRYRMDDIRIGRMRFLGLLRGESAGSGRDRRGDARIVARSLSLADYPFMWAVVAAVLLGPFGGWTDVHTWLTVLLGCHLLIDSVPRLRFVGPANRYLSYGFLPAALLLWPPLAQKFAVGIVGALLLVTLLAGGALALWRQRRLGRPDPAEVREIEELGARLRDLPVERIFVLPMPLNDCLGYLSGKSFLHGWASTAWGVGPREGIYPVLERPLEKIVGRFELDALVLRRDYVEIDEFHVDGARELARVGGYTVYDIRGVVAADDAGATSDPVAAGEA